MAINTINTTLFNNVALVAMIATHYLRQAGNRYADGNASPKGRSQRNSLKYRFLNEDREYYAVIGADRTVTFASGTFSALNEGSGAGVLRCFPLTVFDRMPDAAGARLIVDQMMIPYKGIEQNLVLGLFSGLGYEASAQLAAE
jgi:hypothetical protein